MYRAREKERNRSRVCLWTRVQYAREWWNDNETVKSYKSEWDGLISGRGSVCTCSSASTPDRAAALSRTQFAESRRVRDLRSPRPIVPLFPPFAYRLLNYFPLCVREGTFTSYQITRQHPSCSFLFHKPFILRQQRNSHTVPKQLRRRLITFK